MQSRLFLLMLTFVTACATSAPVQPLWSGLPPGPHGVGYEDHRWYPAEEGGTLLRYRDLVPALEVYDMILHARNFSDERVVELFDTRLFARSGAPRKPGSFARITLTPRDGLVDADYAALAEFLASHGYEVAIGDGADGVDTRGMESLDFVTTRDEATQRALRVLRAR